MPAETISQLPAASSVDPSDLTVIVQGGVTKRATVGQTGLILPGIEDGDFPLWSAAAGQFVPAVAVPVSDATPNDGDVLRWSASDASYIPGAFRPVSLADSVAGNNLIYYSLTSYGLVYKDGAGIVHPLY